MTGFKPGDKVLLDPRFGHAIGVVDKPARDTDTFVVATLSGRRFSTVQADEMRLLPTGALELEFGDRIRINDDAPRQPGGTGLAHYAEFINGVFGYWVLLDAGMRTWIPTDALTAEAGEPR